MVFLFIWVNKIQFLKDLHWQPAHRIQKGQFSINNKSFIALPGGIKEAVYELAIAKRSKESNLPGPANKHAGRCILKTIPDSGINQHDQKKYRRKAGPFLKEWEPVIYYNLVSMPEKKTRNTSNRLKLRNFSVFFNHLTAFFAIVQIKIRH